MAFRWAELQNGSSAMLDYVDDGGGMQILKWYSTGMATCETVPAD